jgi:hypothetical protein
MRASRTAARGLDAPERCQVLARLTYRAAVRIQENARALQDEDPVSPASPIIVTRFPIAFSYRDRELECLDASGRRSYSCEVVP